MGCTNTFVQAMYMNNENKRKKSPTFSIWHLLIPTNWRSVLLRDAAFVLPRGSQLDLDQGNCLAKLIEQCFCRTSMLY